MAVKLDISKAYDRVEWEFLQKIMLKIGLPEQWANLAMETVCIALYSTLINGEPNGFIKTRRPFVSLPIPIMCIGSLLFHS